MRRSLLTYENVIAREVFGGSEAQAFWFVEDVKADMAELAQKLDEAGRTADARKVVIEQRDDRIAALEAENAELRSGSYLVSVIEERERLRTERYKLAYAICGGEDAPGYLDSVDVETLVNVARDNYRDWSAQTDANIRLRKALVEASTRMKNARGAVESNQVADKDVHGTLTRGMFEIAEALGE